MATHSSVLAWRIPGTEEPGGLLSMGLQSRTQLKRLSSSSSSETLGEGGFHFSLYTNLDKNFFSFETSFSFSHRGILSLKLAHFIFKMILRGMKSTTTRLLLPKKKKELRQTEMLVIVMSHKNSYSEIFCMT